MTGERLPHRRRDLRRVDFFQQVTGRTGFDRFDEVGIFVRHRQHHDLRRRQISIDATRRFDPDELRHADVHQHDVRDQFDRELHRFFPVGRFTDELEVGFVREDRAHGLPEQGVVVGDQDPDAVRGLRVGHAWCSISPYPPRSRR